MRDKCLVDEDLRALRALSSLKRLEIRDALIGGSGFQHLVKLPLEEIEIRSLDTRIYETLVKQYPQIKFEQLRELCDLPL